MKRLLAIVIAVILFPSFARAASQEVRDGKYLVLTGKEIGAINPQTPAPTYPSAYRARGHEAAMRLRIYVGTDGKIDDIKIRKFFGDRLVGSYAVRKARETFTFSPPVLNGKPAAVCFDLPVIFLLRPPIGLVSRQFIPGEVRRCVHRSPGAIAIGNLDIRLDAQEVPRITAPWT